VKFITERGYDSAFGARPLKRFLEKSVETLIAREILQGDLLPKQELTIEYDSDKDALFVTKK
jgi:ATP-dependent Clp protease ATP-binding subunit ClpA